MEDLKFVLVARKDLNMRKGKLAVQMGHAVQYLYKYVNTLPDKWEKFELGFITWEENGLSKKITLGVDNEESLLELYNKVKSDGLPCGQVYDYGLTEFHGKKTLTSIWIGPWISEGIDKFTNNLKLL